MAEPDFRALLAELMEWADKTSAHYYVKPELLTRVRTALAAEASRSAVPDGREPAPLVAEPSYELVTQWIAEVWHEGTPVRVAASDLHLAARAAEWGARWGQRND